MGSHQMFLEVAVLGFIMFYASGGGALVIALAGNSGSVVSPFVGHSYPIMEYALYTVLTSAVLMLGVVMLLNLQRNPTGKTLRNTIFVYVVLVFSMLWILQAQGVQLG